MSDFKAAKQFAEENGLVIIESRGDVLQLDIDDEEAMETFKQNLRILRGITPLREQIETVSKSGHRHIYLKTEYQFSPQERICIQASMGSDRKRELLSLRNLKENRELPMFLYETPESARTVEHLTPAWQAEEEKRVEAIFS